jgi:hypothetical protein
MAGTRTVGAWGEGSRVAEPMLSNARVWRLEPVAEVLEIVGQLAE